MRRTILASVAILALFLAAPVFAETAAEKLIKRGDKYYDSRGKGRKWVVKSVECYEKALAVDTKSVPASWKLAKASYWLGVHTEKTDEKIRIYKKGIDAAKRAISLDKKSVESYFWLGVSFGKYGEAKGVMNSLQLVDPIKEAMEKVIELDEKFEGGGAHRVLGRLYFKLPGIAGGSNDKAIEHLKKAIKFDKTRLLNHPFIAEIYTGMDDDKKAIEHLKLVIDGKEEAARKPENAEEKASAKKMLKELTKDEGGKEK
jgi:tetratricopeptide (TPR) repeat protein